jgi:hypothetical protein
MSIPEDRKEQAVYHTILADMHRLHAMMLNLQTLDTASTEQALREHFTREQNLSLGKLMEWKQHRPEIYRQAQEDFEGQVRRESDYPGVT